MRIIIALIVLVTIAAAAFIAFHKVESIKAGSVVSRERTVDAGGHPHYWVGVAGINEPFEVSASDYESFQIGAKVEIYTSGCVSTDKYIRPVKCDDCQPPQPVEEDTVNR